MQQPRGFPQVTYDVEVTANGIAWFPFSSSHFKKAEALAYLKMRRQTKEDRDVRVVRVTKKVIA